MAARDLGLEEHICLAIQNREVLRFRYDNTFVYRLFEPYVIYRSATGRMMVSGLERQLGDKVFEMPAPAKFEITRIRNLGFAGQTFAALADFSSYRAEFGRHVPCAVDRAPER